MTAKLKKKSEKLQVNGIYYRNKDYEITDLINCSEMCGKKRTCLKLRSNRK
jgi:hypothetical protein